jgi:hypothetical protein
MAEAIGGDAVKNVILDTKRPDRLLLLGVLDHPGRNVDPSHSCATSRHLTRDIIPPTSPAANVTNQRLLGRAEKLISVVVVS